MAASQSPARPSPHLKNYIFTDKIGSGTYATVYKAYRKSGQREVVAVKCVSKASLNNVSKENLLTEIELLKTLQHEHIVQLKDFTWDENYIYIIMEFCSGGDLSTFIREQRTLPERIARRFLQQLASALQYMRSKHVSHMDLKPPNILLSSTLNPQLKIGDFGFAHYLIGETDALYLRGSLLYMAPEIVTLRQYNEKADLWSVGVILYECLFSRAPFASKTMKELQSRIKDTAPIEIPLGVQISSSCRDLLLRLLQRDPDLRIPYDEFFSHPFLDFEHRPCSEALQKATDLVTKAVLKDKEGQFQDAIALYCQSLEYFIPAIQYEQDERKKMQIRHKADDYVKRAEELKQLMKPKASSSSSSSPSSPVAASGSVPEQHVPVDPYDELVSLCESHGMLASAVKLGRAAEGKENIEDYVSALEKYERSLEVLLRLLSEEPKGRRRDLLRSQVSQWMSRAETIKRYLTVKDLDTKDITKREAEEDDNHSVLSSCVVQ